MKPSSIVRAGAVALAGALVATVAPPPSDLTGARLPGSPGVASAAEPACMEGWRTLELPVTEDPRYLLDVVVEGGQPSWLLGGSHGAGTLAFRRRGEAWAPVRIPDAGTRGLTSGAVAGKSSLIVSGYLNTPQVGLLGTIQGNRWTSDQLRPDISTLTGIAVVRGKAWAVGARERAGRLQATALRQTKDGWQRLDAPTGRTQSALTAVAAAPGGTVWAVGWRLPASGVHEPLVVRSGRKGKPRSGKSGWKAEPTATMPTGSAVLTGVSFEAEDRGWVVGYHVAADSGRHTPLLQEWDGQGWQAVELPFAEGQELIARDVASDGRGGLWLAGARLAADESEVKGWTAELRAGSWTFRLSEAPPGVEADAPSELRALAAGRSGVMAVGSAEPAMLAQETCEQAADGGAAAADDEATTTRSDDATARTGPLPGASAGPTIRADDDLPAAARSAEAANAADLASLPTFGQPVATSKWKVRDVSRAYGMESRVKTWSGFVADIDGNGWEDIFYSRHLGEVPRLLLADEDGLRDAPEGAFTVVDRHGCDAADLDGSGQADIYCAVGRVRGTATMRNELAMNPATDDGTVVRDSLGASDPLGRGRYPAFLDYDSDGDEDLFLTTVKRRVDALPGGNHLYENVGGRFVPAPQAGLDSEVGSRCLWAGDIDADGDEDILNCVPSPNDGRPSGTRLYRNDRGRFVDRSVGRKVTPIDDIDVAVADVNGDGAADLIQLAEDRLRVSVQRERGFAKVYEARTSDAVAVAVGDVNKDGLADIYVLRGGAKTNGKDVLLVNKGGGKRFESVRIPQTSEGDADDVLAIDVDRNGRTDFVVLNGADRAGPVQLLATLPTK